MSRSIKNRKMPNAVFQNFVCYFSNKQDKRITNRLFRRREKQGEYLSRINREDCFNIFRTREVTDVWNFDSDGLAVYRQIDNDEYKYKMK